MKIFESKLQEFIDSIPPEFNAMREKADELKQEWDKAKGCINTALSMMEFYLHVDGTVQKAREEALKNYESIHYNVRH